MSSSSSKKDEPVKWVVKYDRPPPSLLAVATGYALQLSLVSAWVGGLLVFPSFVLYAGYKGWRSSLATCATIVTLGYVFPPSFRGSKFFKDFYMAYLFAPFKKVSRQYEWLPSRSDPQPTMMLYHRKKVRTTLTPNPQSKPSNPTPPHPPFLTTLALARFASLAPQPTACSAGAL